MKLTRVVCVLASLCCLTPAMASPVAGFDPLTPRGHDFSPPGERGLTEDFAGPAVSPLVRVTADSLPALSPDGDIDGFKTALQRQFARCQELDANVTWKFGSRTVTRRQWCTSTTSAFLRLADETRTFEELWSRARTEFQWYRSKGDDGAGNVMFTGYYLPFLQASRKKSDKYHYPLYKVPPASFATPLAGGPKLRSFSRYEIDWGGALRGRGLELGYITDILDGFFLHIQGSGVMQWETEDGSVKTSMANYAGQNGHEYVSIGKFLRAEGVDEKYLTLQGLRRYFHERPEEIERVLPKNPSYVYFRESTEGPFGSGSTVIVPGHSIATDNSQFPLGAVAFFKTQRPIADENGEIAEWRDFARLAVNQDTGGAIKGPGRVDVYWGGGSYAELAAGNMKHTGELYFAVVP